MSLALANGIISMMNAFLHQGGLYASSAVAQRRLHCCQSPSVNLLKLREEGSGSSWGFVMVNVGSPFGRRGSLTGWYTQLYSVTILCGPFWLRTKVVALAEMHFKWSIGMFWSSVMNVLPFRRSLAVSIVPWLMYVAVKLGTLIPLGSSWFRSSLSLISTLGHHFGLLAWSVAFQRNMHSSTSFRGRFSGDQILIVWCTVDGAVGFGFGTSIWFIRSFWDLDVFGFASSYGRNLNISTFGVATIGFAGGWYFLGSPTIK